VSPLVIMDASYILRIRCAGTAERSRRAAQQGVMTPSVCPLIALEAGPGAPYFAAIHRAFLHVRARRKRCGAHV